MTILTRLPRLLARLRADEGGATEQSYYGASFFTDPKGRILEQASEDADGIVYAEIDTALIGDLRNEWGFFRDRRPEMYAELSS